MANLNEIDIKKIKDLEKYGMPIAQIAEFTGWSPQTVRRVVNGKREVYLERNRQAKALARAEVKKTQEQPAMETATPPAITDEALYVTMKNAMLDAMNEAISGQMRNLRGMVQAAVQAALKA